MLALRLSQLLDADTPSPTNYGAAAEVALQKEMTPKLSEERRRYGRWGSGGNTTSV